MDDAVDNNTEGRLADLDHRDEGTFQIGIAAREVEQLVELDKWQELVAQAQHRRILDVLDAMLGAGTRMHKLDDRALRNSEALARSLHDQRRDNGERERNLHRKAQAFASDRSHIDRAPDLLDIGAHDVHADAAAGYARDFGGRGKTRSEDEAMDLRLRHLLDVGFGRQPVRRRLGLDLLSVEAASVVGDPDDDIAALVIRSEANGASLRLAGRAPFLRRFNAMVR